MLKTIEEVMKFAKKWETKRQKLPFNTDGLVVKVNDRQLYRRLGVVGKAPRGRRRHQIRRRAGHDQSQRYLRIDRPDRRRHAGSHAGAGSHRRQHRPDGDPA